MPDNARLPRLSADVNALMGDAQEVQVRDGLRLVRGMPVSTGRYTARRLDIIYATCDDGIIVVTFRSDGTVTCNMDSGHEDIIREVLPDGWTLDYERDPNGRRWMRFQTYAKYEAWGEATFHPDGDVQLGASWNRISLDGLLDAVRVGMADRPLDYETRQRMEDEQAELLRENRQRRRAEENASYAAEQARAEAERARRIAGEWANYAAEQVAPALSTSGLPPTPHRSDFTTEEAWTDALGAWARAYLAARGIATPDFPEQEVPY